MFRRLSVGAAALGISIPVWVVLFLSGLWNYPGSPLGYTIFSLTFLALLASGFFRQVSYGFLFLVLMLWLGFWLKITVHLLLDYPYGEPTGYFKGDPNSWDEVLRVASLGALGVLIARLIYAALGGRQTMLAGKSDFESPSWYVGIRIWIWSGMAVVAVLLAIANLVWGILQIGLVPRTILVWPLNAVVFWLLANGLVMGIATLLWWDICLGKRISAVIYVALLEAFTSSVSILSRGIYIFHLLPQFLALFKNRARLRGWKPSNSVGVVLAFVLLLMVSLPVVNALRDHYYSGLRLNFDASNLGLEIASHLGGDKLKAMSRFALDRWIGAEGLMAVTAYSEKSSRLFVRALSERREFGKYTIYQEISQSHYRFQDLEKFQFASVPGAIAFLYLSDKYWMVLVGMIFFTLALMFSELLVLRITCNPVLCAIWGGLASNIVAQLGVAPRSLAIFIFEVIFGIVVISYVQSAHFSIIIARINRYLKIVQRAG